MRDWGYKTKEVPEVYTQVGGNTTNKQTIELKIVMAVTKKTNPGYHVGTWAGQY